MSYPEAVFSRSKDPACGDIALGEPVVVHARSSADCKSARDVARLRLVSDLRSMSRGRRHDSRSRFPECQ